jgi:hypothetical protein
MKSHKHKALTKMPFSAGAAVGSCNHSGKPCNTRAAHLGYQCECGAVGVWCPRFAQHKRAHLCWSEGR